MINVPPVEDLINQLGTDEEPASRYALCVVASKRARQIMDRNNSRDNPKRLKEIALACEEIVEGKVKAVKD